MPTHLSGFIWCECNHISYISHINLPFKKPYFAVTRAVFLRNISIFSNHLLGRFLKMWTCHPIKFSHNFVDLMAKKDVFEIAAAIKHWRIEGTFFIGSAKLLNWAIFGRPRKHSLLITSEKRFFIDALWKMCDIHFYTKYIVYT